jgi:hypothetical protein
MTNNFLNASTAKNMLAGCFNGVNKGLLANLAEELGVGLFDFVQPNVNEWI